MAEREDVRWGVAQKFEFIEWRAYWVGRVNRSDLEERFGVSTAQASLDLRAYVEAAPENIEYDKNEKAYLPKPGFQPKYLKLSADRYLRQLDAILNSAISAVDTWFGSPPPAAVMQMVLRNVEPEILRTVLRAIDGRLALDVVYQSINKGTQTRTIVPHGLGFDGHRWHARAWCVSRQEYRDFVISRIISVNGSHPVDTNPSNDIEWIKLVDLKLVAHPKLNDAQRATIERDFGMVNGVRTITTRAALAYYYIRNLNLDLSDDAIPPERKQLHLTNLAEVENCQRLAREDSKKITSALNVRAL